MLNFSELAAAGVPWRVSIDLTEDSSAYTPGVTGFAVAAPKPLFRGPAEKAAGTRFAERRHIIMCGFSYCFSAGAAGVGFELYSDDEAYVPGVGQTFRIWRHISQAAGPYSLCVPQCWVDLSPPDVTTTPVNGATLRLRLTATPPTDGFLLAWGIETSLSFGDMAHSGSPAIFSNP